MVFSSLVFLLYFFPIALAGYFALSFSTRLQNVWLFVVSIAFYAWGEPSFVGILLISIFVNWIFGLLTGAALKKGKDKAKAVVALDVIFNLSILFVFKYLNFFIDNINLIVGKELVQKPEIVLPIGISFFTFQALSYVVDVYRGDAKVQKNLLDMGLYIAFFPQLVAGPIERATNLLPQFQNKRQFDYEKSVDGMRQMLWGFFKKLVVADNCAYAVNNFWDSYDLLPGFSILLIGVLFSFQIYCDFSGYSDIAIGTARLFGINLMRNFNYPYFSRSIPEFWRRWHISLMTWFRDYIYFPLGGSRCARWKLIRNTIIVFLISGLWHGANWTFICWGLYHACLIALFIMLGINTKPKEDLVVGKRFSSIKDILMMIITFLLVMFGWMIFRAESMTQFQDIIRALFANEFFDSSQIYGKTFLLNVIVLLFIEWLQRNKQHTLQLPNNWLFQHQSARWALYVMFYLYIITATGYSQTFLYFQF